MSRRTLFLISLFIAAAGIAASLALLFSNRTLRGQLENPLHSKRKTIGAAASASAGKPERQPENPLQDMPPQNAGAEEETAGFIRREAREGRFHVPANLLKRYLTSVSENQYRDDALSPQMKELLQMTGAESEHLQSAIQAAADEFKVIEARRAGPLTPLPDGWISRIVEPLPAEESSALESRFLHSLEMILDKERAEMLFKPLVSGAFGANIAHFGRDSVTYRLLPIEKTADSPEPEKQMRWWISRVATPPEGGGYAVSDRLTDQQLHEQAGHLFKIEEVPETPADQ